MCDREDEEQLLHEWVEVGQEADPELGTKRLYGIEDLCETSSAMRLLLLLLLELLYGRVHELEQCWHQLTVVFTNLWLKGKNGEGTIFYHNTNTVKSATCLEHTGFRWY